MSDERWQVELQLQDAKSNKFWRARCVGSALEINYGRIGTKGQNQVKRYDSADDSAKEMDKQANAKRKKGYADSAPPQTPPASATAATAGAGAADSGTNDGANNGGEVIKLLLELGERRIELQLSLDGRRVQTTAVEQYASDDDARIAYQQLRSALNDEGYRQV